MYFNVYSTGKHLIAACVVLAVMIGGAFLCGATRVRDPQTAVVDDGGGTIYFETRWDGPARLWTMNVDGTNRMPLPENVTGEPSWAPHGDQRWFLTVREVPGESYPSGHTRRELFAIRADGLAIQLTTQPDLEPSERSPRWIPGTNDSQISWSARRWNAAGQVLEGGLYVATVLFDRAGYGALLTEQPRAPYLSLPLISADRPEPYGILPAPDIRSHDWSPDARAIAYDTARGDLCVVDLLSGTVLRLPPAPAYDPVWSPDGRRIAFQFTTGRSAIATIRPDGTDFTILVPSALDEIVAVSRPLWSPTGSDLLYRYVGSWTRDYTTPVDVDVCRLTLNQGTMQNLTPAWPDFATPVAWRPAAR